jgi:nucleoside 2-deoxyribosyltransferase
VKLYIASSDKTVARWVAAKCRKAGHTVTSRWLGMRFALTETYSEEDRVAIATVDVEDVTVADALVLIASPHPVPGGKFVETGIALGMGKPVLVLGRRENMLMWHPSILQFDSLGALLNHLSDK